MTDLLTQKANSPMEKAQYLVELQKMSFEIKKRIDEYKADLLQVTQDLDVLSLKTGAYTISRAKRITPQVVNFNLLKKSLDKADIPYMTEEVFSKQMDAVFKQAIEEKRELDGLEARETEYITVRIAKDKEVI